MCSSSGRGFGGGDGKGGGNRARAKSAESSLRATIELDKLIDSLRFADSSKLPLIVAENIFAFDQTFWLRLATRADSCATAEDRKDYEELSQTIMTLVERLVRCTEERMDSTSDRLAEVLTAAAVVDNAQIGEEILWPPKDPLTIPRLRQELQRRRDAGELDESFLGSVTAHMRQASEQGDRPGLVAMLQKLLQLYASMWFGQRSFATKEDDTEDKAEKLLETLMAREAEEWDSVLRDGLTLGGGEVTEEEFLKALELRAKRMQMRTEGGSYEQRILAEFLLELELRATNIATAFRSSPAEL